MRWVGVGAMIAITTAAVVLTSILAVVLGLT